ncbi:hypothetical protein EON67_06330 [archaeon]|nr:MAG: hypothetical protein EON67_06330 [archaeon]
MRACRLKTFWPEASEEDVERVMTMKGMNKKDQNSVLVSIGLAKPSTGGAAAFAATSMAAMAMAGSKGADTRNMLGRMGKLFKPGVGGGSSQPSPSAASGAGAGGARK